jgi:hypothetical protein
MSNARAYKSHDPASPNPNEIGWMPTEALIVELISRNEDTIVIYRGEEIRAWWGRDNGLRAIALLEIGKSIIVSATE